MGRSASRSIRPGTCGRRRRAAPPPRERSSPSASAAGRGRQRVGHVESPSSGRRTSASPEPARQPEPAPGAVEDHSSARTSASGIQAEGDPPATRRQRAQAGSSALTISNPDQAEQRAQPHLGGEIVLHRAVIVEMLVGQVGEDARGEGEPVEPALVEAVRGGLHRHVGHAPRRKRGQGRLQVDRPRRGQACRPSRAPAPRAPSKAPRVPMLARRAVGVEQVAHEPGRGGLAVGAGDADQGHAPPAGRRTRRAPRCRRRAARRVTTISGTPPSLRRARTMTADRAPRHGVGHIAVPVRLACPRTAHVQHARRASAGCRSVRPVSGGPSSGGSTRRSFAPQRVSNSRPDPASAHSARSVNGGLRPPVIAGRRRRPGAPCPTRGRPRRSRADAAGQRRAHGVRPATVGTTRRRRAGAGVVRARAASDTTIGARSSGAALGAAWPLAAAPVSPALRVAAGRSATRGRRAPAAASSGSPAPRHRRRRCCPSGRRS